MNLANGKDVAALLLILFLCIIYWRLEFVLTAAIVDNVMSSCRCSGSKMLNVISLNSRNNHTKGIELEGEKLFSFL